MQFFKRREGRSLLIQSQHVISVVAALSMISCVIAQEVVYPQHEHNSNIAIRSARRKRVLADSQALLPHLDARQVEEDDDDSSTSSTLSTIVRSARTTSASVDATNAATVTSTPTDDDATSTTSVSGTSTSTQPAYSMTSLPVPFDSSMNTDNFTTLSCPAFIQSFLSNSTFRECAPVSLLLQNSRGFFKAVQQRGLAQTLDNSCSASLAVCSPLMSSIASNLISQSNCGEEFRRQNALVTQAYAGLIAYEPVFKASCLRDSATQGYCMTEAFYNAYNNTTPASDSNPYYMAIGMDLPDSSKPTCSSCLQQTMNIFAGYARMRGQPLANTYLSAAQHLNAGCGSAYVDQNVQVSTEGSLNTAPRIAGTTQTWMTVVMVLFISTALTI